jgi:hypothetical protein
MGQHLVVRKVSDQDLLFVRDIDENPSSRPFQLKGLGMPVCSDLSNRLPAGRIDQR